MNCAPLNNYNYNSKRRHLCENNDIIVILPRVNSVNIIVDHSYKQSLENSIGRFYNVLNNVRKNNIFLNLGKLQLHQQIIWITKHFNLL